MKTFRNGKSGEVLIGISDKELALVNEDAIADFLEIHLSSLETRGVASLLTSGWFGRICVASGVISKGYSLMIPSNSAHFVAEVRERVEIATTLGIKDIVLGGGKSRSLLPGMGFQEGRTLFRSLLITLMPILEEANVRFLIEPLSRAETNFINTLNEACDILVNLPADKFGIAYDLYHSGLIGERWNEQQKMALKRVLLIHVADERRKLPRLSNESWTAAELRDIVSSGYRGYFSLEVSPEQLAEKCSVRQCIGSIRRIIREEM